MISIDSICEHITGFDKDVFLILQLPRTERLGRMLTLVINYICEVGEGIREMTIP